MRIELAIPRTNKKNVHPAERLAPTLVFLLTSLDRKNQRNMVTKL